MSQLIKWVYWGSQKPSFFPFYSVFENMDQMSMSQLMGLSEGLFIFSIVSWNMSWAMRYPLKNYRLWFQCRILIHRNLKNLLSLPSSTWTFCGWYLHPVMHHFSLDLSTFSPINAIFIPQFSVFMSSGI